MDEGRHGAGVRQHSPPLSGLSLAGLSSMQFSRDTLAPAIRAQLQGDVSHIPQAVRDSKTEFIPANFPTHFPHNLKSEENLGVVPPKWKTTQQLSDPLPPKELRVKSGYTGHVPHVRTPTAGRRAVAEETHAHV